MLWTAFDIFNHWRKNHASAIEQKAYIRQDENIDFFSTAERLE